MTSLIAVIPVTLLLSACDEKAEVSVERHIESAHKLRAAGDLRASAIELKNAVRLDPRNAYARLLLGRNYIALYDPLSAEQELLRASDLGIGRDVVAEPLARAWILQGKYDKVLRELPPNVAGATETRAAILVVRGEAQLLSGALAEAEASFLEALTLIPDFRRAIVGLGQTALGKNDVPQAQKYLAQATRHGADDPDVLDLEAKIAFTRRKFADAETAHQKAFDLQPFNPSRRLALAWSQIANAKYSKAIRHLELILNISPEQAFANYLRALAAFRTRDYEAAKFYAEKVDGLKPDFGQSKLMAGASSFAIDQNEQAYRHLAGFVAGSPSHALARRLLAVTLLRLHRADEAVAALRPLIQKSKDDVELLALIGRAATMSGDLEAGRRYMERLAELRPNDAQVRAQLGAINLGIGDVARSIDQLEEAVRRDPTLDRAQFALLTAYLRAKEFDKAITAAKRLEEQRPKSALGATMRGIVYAAMRKIEDARAAFARAIDIEPGAPSASQNLAVLELRAGNPDRAREILRASWRHHPKHPGPPLALAKLEIGQEKPDQAEPWLERAIANAPNAVEPNLLLGSIYLAGGRPDRALALTEKLVPTHPENPPLLELVGRARMAAGRPADAVTVFRSMVALAPKSVDAHLLLASAYRATRDDSGVEEQLQKVLALDPGHLQAKLNLVTVLGRKGDFDAARNLLAELRESLPGHPEVYELAGGIAALEKRFPDAVVSYRKAMALNPTSGIALKLAIAQHNSGDIRGAVATLRDRLKTDPDDRNAQKLLAHSLAALGRLQEAELAFRTMLRKTPDDAETLNNLAWILLERGATAEALDQARQAYRLAENDAAVMDTLGAILLKAGRPKEALPLLEKASTRSPDNLGMRYRLAQALNGVGQTRRSAELLRSLVESTQPFAEREAARKMLNRIAP